MREIDESIFILTTAEYNAKYLLEGRASKFSSQPTTYHDSMIKLIQWSNTIPHLSDNDRNQWYYFFVSITTFINLDF